MSNQFLSMTDPIRAYVRANGMRPHPAQTALHTAAAALPGGGMQIGPEQAQLLDFLVRSIGATRAIEVGVFAGYSAMSVALALPDDGYLLACEVSDIHVDLARRFWRQAGVSEKIEFRLGDALDTLDLEIARGNAGTYDFAFIDADKRSYPAYYERCLELLRPGGVIAIDNVLWRGTVASDHPEKWADHMRKFNHMVHLDARVDLVLLPFGDGITLVHKR